MTSDVHEQAPGRHARRAADVPARYGHAASETTSGVEVVRLLTPEALGEVLGGLGGDEVLRLAKRHGWPVVRFSPKALRFRPEDVEQIVALHFVNPLSQPSAQVVEFPAHPAIPRQRHL